MSDASTEIRQVPIDLITVLKTQGKSTKKQCWKCARAPRTSVRMPF